MSCVTEALGGGGCCCCWNLLGLPLETFHFNYPSCGILNSWGSQAGFPTLSPSRPLFSCPCASGCHGNSEAMLSSVEAGKPYYLQLKQRREMVRKVVGLPESPGEGSLMFNTETCLLHSLNSYVPQMNQDVLVWGPLVLGGPLWPS